MTNQVNANSSVPTQVIVKKKKKKIASLERRKARAGWIFVLPFIIGFVLIYLPMVYDSIVISVTHTEYVEGESIREFVGIENYVLAFTGKDYTKYPQELISGLGSLAFDLPSILLFSLFMAVLLNQQMAGRALFRSIFFMPVIVATGVIAENNFNNLLVNNMQSGTESGAEGAEESGGLVDVMDIQALFSNLAVGQELVDYVVVMINNIFNIVNRSGVQMLIFLAALQSISPAIYESCKIDGATAWETFWKITFPMISPMILVNAIYTVIDSFTVSTNTVMTYIDGVYGTGGIGREVSTAMSWVYFLIVIAILAVIASVMSAFVFYSRKND